MKAENWIALGATAVALVAVVVGPVIQMAIAKRQMATALQVARLQATAPGAHARVKELTEALSELTGLALHYFVAGFVNRTDSEYLKIQVLEQKVSLLLDPDAPEQMNLSEAVRQMVGALNVNPSPKQDKLFIDGHKAVIATARPLLRDLVHKLIVAKPDVSLETS